MLAPVASSLEPLADEPAALQSVPARTRPGWSQLFVTSLIVLSPLAATVLAMVGLWGRNMGLHDLGLLLGLYLISCLGVTAGYHRLFAHRSFVAARALKIGLAVSGALAVEGSLTSWVANHRRHHRYSDQDGDPHSPTARAVPPAGAPVDISERRRRAPWRGLLHAHVGWLFRAGPAQERRYARDLLADRDLAVISRLFPMWVVLSLAVPFFCGWAAVGTIGGAITALVWGGLVRIFLVHHVTWSINSICHTFGSRPFDTHDRSTNVAALALVSLGESWHNAHHAFPTLARHGVDRGQLDATAACIRVWERLGWVHDVRWPRAELLATRRVLESA